MKIDDLSLADLRTLGETYGLQMPATASKMQLIKLITTSTSVDPDNVSLAVPAESEVKEEPKAPVSNRVKVIFHNTEGDGGNGVITVIPNGRRYDIPREVEVEVPPEVMHIIDNAVITESYYDDQKQIKERHRKRFAYSYV